VLDRLILRLAWQHLPKWQAWRVTMWRSWGREWPQHEFDWYNYALMGVPRLRREITLRHWAGEEDADIARRFQISQNEVVWHCTMTSGHIEAIFEARQRRADEAKYLALLNHDYPATRARMPKSPGRRRWHRRKESNPRRRFWRTPLYH
jgi:hypothetical protein